MIKKSLIAALATAVALAFSPITPASAAPLMGPGSKVAAETSVELAGMKKKKKYVAKKVAKKAPAKKVYYKKKSKGKTCGTYKYYSKKAKKCVDARDKR